MIFHILIVDDEEDVLESLVPGLVMDLSKGLAASPLVQRANEAAGYPLPTSGRLNIKVSAVGYTSIKAAKYVHHTPVHVHLHLCCEKGGSFRHALRLLKEHFFAVVVSDLRFSEDLSGSRAGRFFIEDVHRRNPDTFGILYSAYQKPEGFPGDRFIRKGSSANLAGEELVAKIIEGFAKYLQAPAICRLTRELTRRGLVYQSDAFGAMLRRLFDYASLYFGTEPANPQDRRRPRPTLLIDGETGTGKTELAGLFHQLSDRRDAPFIAATCNQLTDENFLRSILFGHIKGSFSGASSDRPGLVETTGRGTLLLDDLHKLSDGSSVILHSFLDDGEYSHLGQDEIRRRGENAVICTVETPKWEEIKAEEQLAESFINRVEQLVVRVPPLRARPEDIEYQAAAYCKVYGDQLKVEMEIAPAAIAWLVDYGFPGGNSRKLRDFLKGLVAENARVTDYIDLPEIEEYADEIGLIRRADGPALRPSAAPEPAATAASLKAEDVELAGWQARILRLAAQSLADEYEVEVDQAEEMCRGLFREQFPQLWERFQELTRQPDPKQSMEIKLFDELLRYYAVYVAGSPAKAAKQLGMKDNALREFIYSREQKRGLADKS